MSRNSVLKSGTMSEVSCDCNRGGTHNHLVRNPTFNHLPTLHNKCITRKLFRKVSVTSRLKAIWIIDQKKAFYGERIPGPGSARKEIGILIK